MKQLAYVFYFLFLLSSLSANEKPLKIAITEDMVPYSFYDEEGQPNGLFIDYWNLWSKKTAKKIEFVPLKWSDTIKSISTGEVDIHSGLFKNKKREKSLDYSSQLYISQSHIYTTDTKRVKFSSFNDLEGETIGLLSGTYFEDYMERKHPNIKLKKFNTLEGMFLAVKNQEIEFFIDDSLIIWFQLIRNFSFNKVSMLPDFQLNKWFHAAVKKGNTELNALIAEGMSKITIDELIEIEQKWIIEDAFRYFEQKRNSDFLTYEERLWLLKNPSADIALVKDWEKFSINNKNGKIEGFHVDLVKQINENLNINLKIKVYDNWTEAYEATKDAKSYGIPGLSWSKQREKLFDYSPSYHYSPYYMITRKSENNIKSVKDLNNKIAITYKNSITNKLIKESFSPSKILHVTSVKQILESIRDKKADVALIENAKVIDLDKYNIKVVDSVFSKYSELSIGVPKKERIFSSIIKKGINSISEAQLTKLKKRWLNQNNMFSQKELLFIQNSKPLVVGVEDWTAIMGMNDDNKLIGIGGEFVFKAFERTGLKFKFVKNDWNVLLKEFKEGKIDLLPSTSYTKQRDEYGDFTKQYLSLKNFIYVKSNNTTVNSLRDLNYKKIAIQKDFATITLIKEKFPNIEILETKDLEESISKVLNGQADALFELQISVENKMKEFLITNLKAVSQDTIKAQGLHIFTQEKQDLLRSILNKSLDSIPGFTKNQIISKWFTTLSLQKEVKAAFAVGRAPYIVKNEYMKGIEYDLVKKILDLSSIVLKETKNISRDSLENVLIDEDDIDMAVNIKEDRNINLFYSDPFIEFNNIVVTRKKDGIRVNKVEDLKNLNITAFKNAYRYLGKEFYMMFNLDNRKENYKEASYQEKQVNEFLNGKGDLIILDENIFKWYFNKHNNIDIDELDINYMFSKANNYKVAFKDKNLRDNFNKNLKKIKASGEYKEVVDNYIQGYMESKIKINFLISSLVSNSIHAKNQKDLEIIIESFTSLPYINKIEVLDNQSRLLYTNTTKSYKNFLPQDSYYINARIPRKVGQIRVYFNNKGLKEYRNSYVFVPQLEVYENLKNYRDIKKIYESFGYINEKINFTKEEKAFIKNSKTLKIGIDEWKSILDKNDSGKLDGIAGELIQEALKLSGLKYTFEKDEWPVLLEAFKKGEYDILPASNILKERYSYANFTKKYLSIKNYIYTRSDNTSVKSLKDLENKKVAVQEGYATISLIKEKFPKIEIVETKDLGESIEKVLNAEVDALFALQLSIEKYIRDELIMNLKSISQSSIKNQALHMMIGKDQVLLKSILDKSISAIPSAKRNKIISKWINTKAIKNEVNVVFPKSMKPYYFDSGYVKGIDYDLVNTILNMNSISIKNSMSASYFELDDVLNKNDNYDVAVSTSLSKDDSLFYSKLYSTFENVVVSRLNDDFIIEDIKDLEDKNILAFEGAYKYLGKMYKSQFSLENRPKTYNEIINQEEQVRLFLANRVDLIILDKNIFKWLLQKHSGKNIDDFTIHKIFPNKVLRYVAFKDKKIRDIFNKNLKDIKKSGEYNAIISDYTNGYIESKIKMNSLISSIMAKYIASKNLQELNKIVNIFTSMPYIDKIEVSNNEGEILVTSATNGNKFFTIYDSYDFMLNMPSKVGQIKVFFNNEALKNYKDESFFIPHISLFKNLENYDDVKKIYRNFGYSSDKIIFTSKEMDFLKEHKKIKYSTSHWQPISIVENERHSGVISDYLELIEKETGLEFEYVNSDSWLDVLDKFNKKEIDIIPGIGDVAFNLKNVYVTNELTDFKYAIVSNKGQDFLDGIEDLEGLTIATPKGYSSNKLLKSSPFKLNIIDTKDEKEALSLVANGEADVFVGHSSIAIFNIKNNFPDLKIVGLTDERFYHHIAIQDEYPVLLSILNKVIYNITPKQKQDIKYKWIQTEVSTAVDASIIYKIVAGFTLILIIVLVFTRKLSSAKSEIERTNLKLTDTVKILESIKEELTYKTKDLKEQKNIFETLFSDTSDGLLLVRDGKFIDCNNSVLKMIGSDSKDKFLNLRPAEISPKKQPCGAFSSEKSSEHIAKCLSLGSDKFEWMHKKFTGENFWVEVVLTKIVLNYEDIIHVVWRDIADKKVLEEQNLNRTFELEDANQELELSLKNLKQTQNQLIESEKMASLGALVAGVAHEINTPIGIGLTGSTHFLEITDEIKKAYEIERMTQEDFEEYLKTSNELASLITVNLRKAASLVKSFKQVAVDQTSEEKRLFVLNDYIKEVLSSIHSVTKKTKLDIKVTCDKKLKINSYPGAFSQVITNLIMNSIIHGFEKGEKGILSIDIIKKEDKIIMVYKDNGKGIPPENITKIFDPFFTTNRENGGSGLGLNIIYNIINTKLNGKIKCNSQAKGVEFIVTLNN